MPCFPANNSVEIQEKLFPQILHDAKYKPLHRVCSLHFEDLSPNAPVTPHSPYGLFAGARLHTGPGVHLCGAVRILSRGTGPVEFWYMHYFSSWAAYWLRDRKITKRPVRYDTRALPFEAHITSYGLKRAMKYACGHSQVYLRARTCPAQGPYGTRKTRWCLWLHISDRKDISEFSIILPTFQVARCPSNSRAMRSL